jgi:hypothetical protein
MAAGEPISPELVLVDPELAGRAREALGRRQPSRPGADAPVESCGTATPLPTRRDDAGRRHAEAAPLRPPRNRCVVPSLLSGLLGALIVALAISFKSTPGYYMPPLPSTEPSAATQPPETTDPTTTTGAPAPRRPFRVSWKPERDAVGYEVALVRGSSTLYRAYSLQTSLELPARWSFRGREHVLAPGVYKWFVWPVRAGGARDASPTVRRTLVIPGARP